MDGYSILMELRLALTEAAAKGVESVQIDRLKALLDEFEADPDLQGGAGPAQTAAIEKYKAQLHDWTEQLGHQRAWALEEFRTVILMGQAALKSAILINGGAAAALLAFLGHLATSPSAHFEQSAIAGAMLVFVFGVLLSAVASGATYLGQNFLAADAETWMYRCGRILLWVPPALVVGAYVAFGFGGWSAYSALASNNPDLGVGPMAETGVMAFLNANSGVFNLLFTGVVAIATAAYAVLTIRLVKETSGLRKAQTEPRIEITPSWIEETVSVLRLRIRNIGLGPAYGIAFVPTVVAGGDAAKAVLAEFTASSFFHKGLNYLGPGEERVSLYTDMAKDSEGKLAAVLQFKVTCRGATSEQYSWTFTVDLGENAREYRLGKPHLFSIAQSLEKLQADINQVATGFRKLAVNTFDSSDREAQRKRREADTKGQ